MIIANDGIGGARPEDPSLNETMPVVDEVAAEALETTITSRRLRSEFVVEWRSRSTSALIDESFSIKVSVCGT